jgi:hypothetical protein
MSQYLRRLVAGFSPRLLGIDPRSGYVGFMMEKILTIALLHIHLSPGTAIICPLVAGVTGTLSLTQPHATN